jgi:type IV secretion system protein VirD4
VGEVGGVIYGDDRETHCALFGPTRSRKGTCHIVPTLTWLWRQSALITDPKNGENYRKSGAARERYGRVEVFAPYDSPDATCRINVCNSIHWRQAREFGDALAIGSSLTAPDRMQHESATGKHFRDLASLLLAASQLHVWYTTDTCSLAQVWQFLTQRPGKSDGRKLLETLKVMRTTAHVSGGVHEAIATISNAIANISGDRELGSIWSTAIRPLILYNDPYVARATDTSTLNLRDLQHGPVPLSLYLLAPSPADVSTRLYPVYRVVIETAMRVLMERKGQAQPEDYQHRLLLCLDELPIYGYIPTLDGQVATIAGYGMKGFFIAQDLPMFEHTYGEENVIWGNTDLKLFHAPANDLTAKRISENFLGRMTVEMPVISQGRGGRTVSLQHTSRALLTPDEVQDLDPSLGIARLSGEGLKPFLFRKMGYVRNYKEAKR